MILRPLLIRYLAAALAPAIAPIAAEPIAALAHIQPRQGVLALNGPPGDSVTEVLVTPGQNVRAGDVLMTLESAPGARAEVALAETTLQEVREQQPLALAQLQIEVRQAEADLAYASSRLERYNEAGTAKIAPQLYSDQINQAATARIVAEIRHNRLTALSLQNATAMSRAEAQLAAAKARLELSSIHAPANGIILELLAGPGEATGTRPIVRLAELSEMCVIADVFESDLRRVRLGATAVISSKTMPKSVTGQVLEVGRIITGEGKVGKVKILADEAAPLAGLIDAEVDVLINE